MRYFRSFIAGPLGAAFLFFSLISTGYAQVRDVASPNLSALKIKANIIISNHLFCTEIECRTFPCLTKARLLQDLHDTDLLLDQYLQALNARDQDLGVQFAALMNNGEISFANWNKLKNVVHTQQTFHDIGSYLLDIASLAGTFSPKGIENFLDKGKLDKALIIYETLKDAESFLNTSRSTLGKVSKTIDRLPKESTIIGGLAERGVPADAINKVGLDGNNVKSNVNDYVSHIADTQDAIRGMKEAHTALKNNPTQKNKDAFKDAVKEGWIGLGKIVGRGFKAYSQKMLDESTARMKAHGGALLSESAKGAEIYREWIKNSFAQRDAQVALKAIRRARALVAACLEKWCGTYTLKTRVRQSFINAKYKKYSWGKAVQTVSPKLINLITKLNPGKEIKPDPYKYCPPEAKYKEGAIRAFGSIRDLNPSDRFTTTCKNEICRGIVYRMNLIKTRLQAIDQNIKTIGQDFDKARNMRDKRNDHLDEAARLLEEINNMPTYGPKRKLKQGRLRAQVHEVTAKAGFYRDEAKRLRLRKKELPKLYFLKGQLDSDLTILKVKLEECEAKYCSMARGKTPDKKVTRKTYDGEDGEVIETDIGIDVIIKEVAKEKLHDKSDHHGHHKHHDKGDSTVDKVLTGVGAAGALIELGKEVEKDDKDSSKKSVKSKSKAKTKRSARKRKAKKTKKTIKTIKTIKKVIDIF